MSGGNLSGVYHFLHGCTAATIGINIHIHVTIASHVIVNFVLFSFISQEFGLMEKVCWSERF